jgi:hypothetical protein
MIGTSRNRQTSKSLRVCSSMPPRRHWGGVEHHHRTVDRGQGAVGVLAEILVARRVEQVEGEPLMLKAHHRRGDRDAALALDRHPIRPHPPPLAARLDLARQLDRPAEQQQFLGQRGLAGVRMRNNRKGPPARNLVGQGTHQSASAVAGGGLRWRAVPLRRH